MKEYSGKNIIFEQDGEKDYINKENKLLLNKLFPEGKWIQNPPDSPDLVNPIEDLLAIIKPRIKRRQPLSLDKLRKYIFLKNEILSLLLL